VEQAKIIMTIEKHTPVAAAQSQPTNEIHQLHQQITELTAQVAALSTQQSRPRPPAIVDPRAKRCFLCNKVGHLQYSCPTTRQDPKFCFTCGQQGHGWRTCPQGNGQGATAWGSSRPPSVSPQLVTVATVRNNATVIIGKVGSVAVEIMLDTFLCCVTVRHFQCTLANPHQDVTQSSLLLLQGSHCLLFVVLKPL